MKRLSDRKKASERKSGKKDGGKSAKPKTRAGNWGRVLRTAYDDTLRESVPDEFLDLLGKLD
jgi:hypothetical protein